MKLTKMMPGKRALLVIALIATASATSADRRQPLQFASGENQVALLELYTSEGCSSCPPADRWFSSLKEDTGLWREFVPIALHVDYWNYIGWEDRFASAEFSQRQRDYVRSGAVRVPYTPGMFRGGEEWLDWRRGTTPFSNDRRVGNLSLDVEGRSVTGRFEPTFKLDGTLQLNVAILGMQLETVVKAGENRGHTLRHDFVALQVQKAAMQAAGPGYTGIAELAHLDTDAKQLALVAWVSINEDPAPVQSVGGYLP